MEEVARLGLKDRRLLLDVAAVHATMFSSVHILCNMLRVVMADEITQATPSSSQKRDLQLP